MRLISLILILLFLIPVVNADVKLLVQAKEYWKDGKPTLDWTAKDFKDFWRQTHKGEIIDVFPSEAGLGTMDIPPSFVQIIVIGVTVEQAQTYLEPILEGPSDSLEFVKQRRWHFRRVLIDSALTLWDADGSLITLTKAQALTLLKQYNLAAIKQKIKDRLKR